MKIKETGYNIFADSQRINKSLPRTLAAILSEKEESPVQVTISDEAKEYYRKRVQEVSVDSESYDTILDEKNKILEANLQASDIDYNFTFGEEVGKYRKDGVNLTIEDKVNNLLKAYASLYNEMVQGYENGTREIHIEDESSEKGYRILTMDEEINELNLSYKKYADSLEEQLKQEPEIRNALEKYKNKLDKIDVKKVQNDYANLDLTERDEINPDKISDKLMDAASIFREKYIAAFNKVNITELLSTIRIV